jgi:two-component sensor histidine kinase
VHASDVAKRAGGHFVLIDRNGQQLINTRRPPSSPLPETANKESLALVLERRRPVIGNLATGAIARETLFSVRVPVTIAGEVKYVLSYVPRSGAMLELVRESYLPPGWYAGIIDGNGKIVARSHRHDDFFGKQVSDVVRRQLVGQAGLIETVDLEGRPSVTAFHASGASDWRVFVWAPKALLQEPATQGIRFLSVSAIVAIALSLMAAAVASWVIHRPTTRLLQAAVALGEGRQVSTPPSLMKEANLIGFAIEDASALIAQREQSLRDREVHTHLLMRELSHRSKNLLAIIQAMATQSARMTHGREDFLTNFRERLSGLARSHDLLVKEDWGDVALVELIRAQLDPFAKPADARFEVSGPVLRLNPQAAQTLGLALHELATNCVKHGAWSAPAGVVRIEWERPDPGGEADSVRFRWIESGGPAPQNGKNGNGFGHTILTRIAPSSLQGVSSIDWRADGLEWTLEAPASALTVTREA